RGWLWAEHEDPRSSRWRVRGIVQRQRDRGLDEQLVGTPLLEDDHGASVARDENVPRALCGGALDRTDPGGGEIAALQDEVVNLVAARGESRRATIDQEQGRRETRCKPLPGSREELADPQKRKRCPESGGTEEVFVVVVLQREDREQANE